MTNALLFDRRAVRRNRDRAHVALAQADFLHRASAGMLADRVQDLARSFSSVAEIGVGGDLLRPELAPKLAPGARYLSLDLSLPFLKDLPANRWTVQADEEALPLAPGAFDLIVSNLCLHWVNDLPGCLAQIRRALKPDGVMIVTLFGGETLAALYQAFMQAESQTMAAMSQRTAPRVALQEAAGLLQRAGFALPVADRQRFAVSYPHIFKLMHDLRAMGETNAMAGRLKTFSRRDTMLRLGAAYRELSPADGPVPDGEERRIKAEFEVLTLTGWAPDASQQQPLRPGAGKISLANFLVQDLDEADEG